MIAISLEGHLAPAVSARPFRFDAIMPLNLTAYVEDFDLNPKPKKRKFRAVVGGIVSLAREAKSGKLRYRELRNAKNNFIVNDLGYGNKESNSA